MIGALYLCISVPNVCSSIVVGKLTDILVRILHNCYGPKCVLHSVHVLHNTASFAIRLKNLLYTLLQLLLACGQ